MKREINVISQIDDKNFSLIAIEKIPNSGEVVIYDKKHSNNDTVREFFSNSITELEKIINGKIKNIFVMLRDSKMANLEIDVVSQKSILSSEKGVTHSNIRKNMEVVRKHPYNSNKVIINLSPFKYKTTKNNVLINYLTPPIDKEIDELEIFYSRSMIDKNIYKAIIGIFEKTNIEIKEILTLDNALAFSVIDPEKLKSGQILLNVQNNFSSISFVKANSMLVTKNFKTGLNSLIKKISEAYNLSDEESFEVFKIYGKIVGTKEEANLLINGKNSKLFCEMVRNFAKWNINKVLNFINENKIPEKVSLQIYGELNSLENLSNLINNNLEKLQYNIYQVSQLTSWSTEAREAIGFIKYINRSIELLNNKHDTLIETRPHSIDFLPNKGKRFINSIIKKFTRKDKHV